MVDIQKIMPMIQQATQAISQGAPPEQVVPQAAVQIGGALGGEQGAQIAQQVAGQVLSMLG